MSSGYALRATTPTGQRESLDSPAAAAPVPFDAWGDLAVIGVSAKG